ncbi:MAG: endonuclease/exonuclease/phosphatase family protein [Prevotellaceae bacterium]|jgi:endonuclease/exonuclease/phosphatase family metal-dependent hydrolase|nr:endonuclease/exonuclease/phosphatase family protein [Prevotellaceae bacterium]
MKRLGKVIIYLILAINLLFAGLLLLAAYSPHLRPTAHPILSCFGMAFPIFLLIDAGFLIFWLLIRRFKTALLPLITILLCWSQVSTYLPINSHTDKLPEGCIKLLSYNIMAFDGAAKKEGENPILNYLKESGADIMCLQEYFTRKNPAGLTQEDVAHALAAYPYHDIQPIGSVKGYSNRIACYSKYPILSSKRVAFESQYNGAVIYELLIDNDTVMLINNHLESNRLTKDDKVVYENLLNLPEQMRIPDKEEVKSGARLLINKLAEASTIRAQQVDTLARKIADSTRSYIISCGDFNDTPISYTLHTLTGHLKDAFGQSGRGLGISFNQNKFYFRIDHILVSRNWKTYNCTVDNSIKESDHYPIWCYLKKEKK